MESSGTIAVPSGHTPDGGVLVGADNARRRLVLFEDPQCPYCRRFEKLSGDLLLREIAAGAVAIEYRMRCFLGVESVRADNALALAAEEGKFDQLRRELFAHQPPEQTGGLHGHRPGRAGKGRRPGQPRLREGVTEGRYEEWVAATDRAFEEQDPEGTPAGALDGRPVEREVLYDPERLGALLRT